MFNSNPASNMRTDLKQVEYQNRIALQRPSYNYEAKPLQENNHHITQRNTKTPEDPSFQKTKSKIEELQHIINELQANRTKQKISAYKTENSSRAISQNRQKQLSPQSTSPMNRRCVDKNLDYSTNHPNNIETWFAGQISEFTPQKQVEKSRMLTPPPTDENKYSDLFTRYISNIKIPSPKFQCEDQQFSSRKQHRPSVSPVLTSKKSQNITPFELSHIPPAQKDEIRKSPSQNLGQKRYEKPKENLTCVSAKKQTYTPMKDSKNENQSQQTTLVNSVLPDSLIVQNIDNFTMGKVLGLGSYAVVRIAVHKPSGMQMAIKTYEKSKLVDQQKKKNVTREMKILSKLRHANIIKLHQACETNSQLHLIMEYTTANSLNSYLKSKQSRKIDEPEAKLIFRQVVDAIRYCHNKNVVHRDIKLENILVDDKKYIKLIDFGFSIAIDPTTKLNVFCGTPSYMAPEIVNKVHYSFPADVWALGILLYKMITGNFPFRGSDDKELYRRINSGKIEFPSNISPQGRSLVSKLLKVNQIERPSAKEVLQDDWFSISMDFEQI